MRSPMNMSEPQLHQRVDFLENVVSERDAEIIRLSAALGEAKAALETIESDAYKRGYQQSYLQACDSMKSDDDVAAAVTAARRGEREAAEKAITALKTANKVVGGMNTNDEAFYIEGCNDALDIIRGRP